MTDLKTLQVEVSELRQRVEWLENALSLTFRDKAKKARTAARRYNNLIEQETRQFELFDGLASDLEGMVTARDAAKV